MDCGRILDQLSAYVDGELSKNDFIDVESHISDCAACRAELAALNALVRATVQIEAIEPPSSLRSRIAAATTHKRKTNWITVTKQMISARPIAWAGALASAAAALVLFVNLGNVNIDEPVAQHTSKPQAYSPATAPLIISKEAEDEPATMEPSPIVVANKTPPPIRSNRPASAKAKKQTTAVALAPKPTIPKAVKAAEPVVVETHTVKPQLDEIIVEDTTQAEAATTITIEEHKQLNTKTAAKNADSEHAKIAASPAVSNDNAEQWIEEMKAEAAMHRKGRQSSVVSVINARF